MANLSFSSTPISVFTEQRQQLATATGFFFGLGSGDVYLVTNWHVVTGRSPRNPSISARGAVPVWATIKFHSYIDGERVNLSQIDQFEFRLNEQDGETPNWLEHPTYGHRVDVVCIKLPRDVMRPNGPRTWTYLEEADFESTYRALVMHDAFIVGYPWGLTGGSSALPIFKRGSVASEPDIAHGGLPRFLIDSRTSEGMSGSPVIGASSGIWGSGSGQLPDSDVFGTVTGFIGVYSGRLEADELPSDPRAQNAISELGLVWQPRLVSEIIAGGKPGSRISELI